MQPFWDKNEPYNAIRVAYRIRNKLSNREAGIWTCLSAYNFNDSSRSTWFTVRIVDNHRSQSIQWKKMGEHLQTTPHLTMTLQRNKWREVFIVSLYIFLSITIPFFLKYKNMRTSCVKNYDVSNTKGLGPYFISLS